MNCYNNFLTRFFAKMFGKALAVDFHGKMRTINKKSYIKLLNSHGVNAHQSNILQFANFNQVMKTRNSDWSQGGFMRDFLSKSKSQKLFKKLIAAIQQGNVVKAQKFAGQGANIEQDFWEKSNHDICLNSLTKQLPARAWSGTATKLTPLFYSAKKNYSELSKFLVKIGARKDFESETTQVNRSLLFSAPLYAYSASGYTLLHRTGLYNSSNPSQHVVIKSGGGMQSGSVELYEDKFVKLSKHTLSEDLNFITENLNGVRNGQ